MALTTLHPDKITGIQNVLTKRKRNLARRRKSNKGSLMQNLAYQLFVQRKAGVRGGPYGGVTAPRSKVGHPRKRSGITNPSDISRSTGKTHSSDSSRQNYIAHERNLARTVASGKTGAALEAKRRIVARDQKRKKKSPGRSVPKTPIRKY